MTNPLPEIHIQSFEELERYLIQIKEELRERKPTPCVLQSEPLFRGHACSSWRLQTTLERFIPNEKIFIREYNTFLARTRPTVETITKRSWRISDSVKLSYDELFDEPPNLEFMAYARHHGFPSPLLDWSRSPYVALYFAFIKANQNQDTALFVFIKSPEGVRSASRQQPQICELSQLDATHARHFSQQSRYTICVQHDEDDDWTYCSHHELFIQQSCSDQNDLRKLIIPGSLRLEILDRLDHMNINGYTLFNSEDGLMEALSFREIEALEARRRGEI